MVEPQGAAMVIRYRDKEQTFYYVSVVVVKTPYCYHYNLILETYVTHLEGIEYCLQIIV